MFAPSFDPSQCRAALAGASFAVVDLETTGLLRWDRIVTAGVLVDGTAYTLFTPHHRHNSSFQVRITIDQLRDALAPLANKKLTIIFHNAAFDLGHLRRIGLTINATIRDTQKLLKLYDPDRIGRRRIRWKGHEAITDAWQNNKLKPVLRHLLNIDADEFPGDVTYRPMAEIAEYLTSDLHATQILHDWLMCRLSPQALRYHKRLVTPLTPLLVAMNDRGVAADRDFIVAETLRLQGVLDQLSIQHHALTGVFLDDGHTALRTKLQWLVYEHWQCSKRYPRWLTDKARKANRKEPRKLSVCRDVLLWHRDQTQDPLVQASLGVALDYLLVSTQHGKLVDLLQHITRDGIIHATFSDHQASGRIAATNPNLQALPSMVGPGDKTKYKLVSPGFENVTIKARNALIARDGYTLVAYDVAQADIRVLAHLAESFKHDDSYVDLQRSRREFAMKGKKRLRFLRADAARSKCLNKNYRGQHAKRPEFDPDLRSNLADDFRKATDDFYSVAATRMLGRPPAPGRERNKYKQTILGIVNGKGAVSLGRDLGVSTDEAAELLAAFFASYPKETAYLDLMRHVCAVTGSLSTFRGLKRRVTAHHWMTHHSMVEVRISYRGADKLWLRVVPIRAKRHTLTCYVINAIDCGWESSNRGKEIYHRRGDRIEHYYAIDRFGSKERRAYRFFKDDLLYKLPIRNLSWRLIREVRTAREAVRYEGFDRTSRQIINHQFQGGTADVSKTMMLRVQRICRKYGAHLLLNIHDELVFECPDEWLSVFVPLALHVLEKPPTRRWNVPIVVEPKLGKQFGELKAWPRKQWKWLWWRRRFS